METKIPTALLREILEWVDSFPEGRPGVSAVRHAPWVRKLRRAVAK
jgi:hypothetical protein